MARRLLSGEKQRGGSRTRGSRAKGQRSSALIRPFHVMRFHIKSELIGQWIYCFTTPLIGYQLEAIGFWYSFKHCAYIYSGTPKENIADDETLAPQPSPKGEGSPLDEIRARLGNQLIN